MTAQAPWVAKFGLQFPYGKCQCGCGQDASIATTNQSRLGRIVGQPSRFIHGHNSSVSPHLRFTRNIKIDEATQCWEWQAARTEAGYGLFLVNRKLVYAHRFSYENFNGPIPVGMHICHSCDNPPCCNPAHLFPGTDADNLADMHSKGRGYIPSPLRGEQNFNARLTESDIREIRQLHARGQTGVSLSLQFNVRTTTISAIVNHKSWKHIT